MSTVTNTSVTVEQWWWWTWHTRWFVPQNHLERHREKLTGQTFSHLQDTKIAPLVPQENLSLCLLSSLLVGAWSLERNILREISKRKKQWIENRDRTTKKYGNGGNEQQRKDGVNRTGERIERRGTGVWILGRKTEGWGRKAGRTQAARHLLCLNSGSASFGGQLGRNLKAPPDAAHRCSFFSLILEDATLPSFVASHIPRFFAHPKKKKEREKMATSLEGCRPWI